MTIREIQEQIWTVAIKNADNPLGYKLLDAHIESLKESLNKDYRELKDKLEAIREVL